MYLPASVLAFACSAVITFPAFSQVDCTNTKSPRRDAERSANRARDNLAATWSDATDSGLLSSQAASPKFAMQLVASSDSSTARITATHRRQLAVDSDGHAKSLHFTVSASAPLENDEPLTDIATLDGLVNSANVALAAKVVTIKGFKSSEELKTACNYDLLAQESRAYCKEVARRDGVLTEQERVQCEDDVVEFDFDKLNNDRLLDACAVVSDPLRASFMGGQIKVGHKDFDFLDPTDFSEDSQSESPVSVSLYYGYSWSKSQSVLAGFDFQNGYKSADSETRCSPTPSEGGTLECKTGAFDGPIDADKELIFLEYRHRFKSFAIEPRLTRDFKESITGVDVPVFLWKDKKGNLSGGLRFGWRDDTDDFTVGVFVGADFSHLDTD